MFCNCSFYFFSRFFYMYLDILICVFLVLSSDLNLCIKRPLTEFEFRSLYNVIESLWFMSIYKQMHVDSSVVSVQTLEVCRHRCSLTKMSYLLSSTDSWPIFCSLWKQLENCMYLSGLWVINYLTAARLGLCLQMVLRGGYLLLRANIDQEPAKRASPFSVSGTAMRLFLITDQRRSTFDKRDWIRCAFKPFLANNTARRSFLIMDQCKSRIGKQISLFCKLYGKEVIPYWANISSKHSL